MTDASYDWSELTGRATKRLRAPKVVPVPASIVRQAQLSWDGEKDAETGELLHNRDHRFPSDEVAAEFARLMRHAGNHTTPETSVRVVIDPDGTGDLRTVSWRAGARRGAKSA